MNANPNMKGTATMSAYYKEQTAKLRLRALRSGDKSSVERKYYYDKHREKLKTVRPVVNSKTSPIVARNLFVTQTKFNRCMARFNQIELDNVRMVHRIATIMQGSPAINNRLKPTTKALFPKCKTRQVELMDITFDNMNILQRIEKQKPMYDRKKLLKDYQLAEKHMERISCYPLFWKSKKKSTLDKFHDSAIQNAKDCPRPRVYMDFETDKAVGRIVIELRADIVPITAENFRCLCTGENGPSYKCTQITRVIKSILIQGGDISGKVYGMSSGFGDSFPHENYKLKHDEPGIVTMVNYGFGSVGSTFMITGRRLRHLDGRNIAVGKVIEGMDILNKFFENVAPYSDRPTKEVWITGCGQLSGDGEQEEEPETENDAPKTAIAPKRYQSRRPVPVKKYKRPSSVRPATTTDTERESSAIPEPEYETEAETD